MIKFGPSGNSLSFYEEGNKRSEQAPEWISGKGLSLYEYSFGRGVNVSDEKCVLIGENAARFGVEVSVHAPYYINLANTDDAMIEKSFGYLLKSAEKVRLMGGNRIIFHPAALGRLTREDAVKLTKERLALLAERIKESGFSDLFFCIETMGKINQIGTLEEVAEFCTIADCFIPTIDFGHLNARTLGGMNSYEEYLSALELLRGVTGEEKTKKMHVHFSKVEYGKGGEIRHLTFADEKFGPDFAPLAPVLLEYAPDARVICESDGTQAEDAVTMMKICLGSEERKSAL